MGMGWPTTKKDHDSKNNKHTLKSCDISSTIYALHAWLSSTIHARKS